MMNFNDAAKMIVYNWVHASVDGTLLYSAEPECIIPKMLELANAALQTSNQELTDSNSNWVIHSFENYLYNQYDWSKNHFGMSACDTEKETIMDSYVCALNCGADNYTLNDCSLEKSMDTGRMLLYYDACEGFVESNVAIDRLVAEHSHLITNIVNYMFQLEEDAKLEDLDYLIVKQVCVATAFEGDAPKDRVIASCIKYVTQRVVSNFETFGNNTKINHQALVNEVANYVVEWLYKTSVCNEDVDKFNFYSEDGFKVFAYWLDMYHKS